MVKRFIGTQILMPMVSRFLEKFRQHTADFRKHSTGRISSESMAPLKMTIIQTTGCKFHGRKLSIHFANRWTNELMCRWASTISQTGASSRPHVEQIMQ